MAGELLTAPGQIEWAGLLFDVRGISATGYWLSDESALSGWQVAWEAADLPTQAGSAPGYPVPQAMYPTVVGLCVETAAQVQALKAAMIPTLTPSPLCWWDRASDLLLSADAVPRRCEPSTAQRVQRYSHRLVDLMWMVPRPLDIEDLDES